YSAITNIDYQKIPLQIKERFLEIITRFKKSEEAVPARAVPKFKITESPKLRPAPAPVPEEEILEEEDEIVDEVEELTDEEEEVEETEASEDEDEYFDDSGIDATDDTEEEDLEEIESPFVAKKQEDT